MTERKLTVEQFKARLAEIKAELAARPSDAAFRDQEFAKLYEESHWTQEEIAKAAGVTQQMVSRRLLFARFLSWLQLSVVDLPLKRLTEYRFQKHYHSTSLKGEEPRFKLVLEALLHPWRAPDVARQIVSSVRVGSKGGTWFTAEEMAEKHEIPLATVKQTIGEMRRGDCGDGLGGSVLMDDRPYKATRQYLIREVIPGKGRVDWHEYIGLVTELERGLEEIKAVADGRTWTSTSPENIRMQLHTIETRLKAARKFIRENCSRSTAGEGRQQQRGVSVIEGGSPS